MSPLLGVRAACQLTGRSRATYYRRLKPAAAPAPRAPRGASPIALSPAERQNVLDVLHQPRYADLSPTQVRARELDENRYHASVSTMYRILREQGETRERRRQGTHPPRKKPELMANGPSQIWSWDITKLRGPDKGVWYQLYVLIDIYSRYVTGWMCAANESADLAEALIADAIERNGTAPLSVHADRGTSMTSRTVAELLSSLDVHRSHARPRVSNDNPYSEAQGGAPPLIRDVRPWLDVIPGGAALDEINGMIFGSVARGKAHSARLALAEVLATISADYDWILIDCPPREVNLQDMVLVATRAVLVPVSFDQVSRHGLSGVAERYGRARQLNETLELLGVAMFGFQYRVKKNKTTDALEEVGQRKDVRAELAADLRAAGSDAPVFDSVIRYMPSVAKSARDRGQLVYELETATGPRWWEVRAGTATGRAVPNTEAAKVAQEYEDLAAEVFNRFMQLDQQEQM